MQGISSNTASSSAAQSSQGAAQGSGTAGSKAGRKAAEGDPTMMDWLMALGVAMTPLAGEFTQTGTPGNPLPGTFKGEGASQWAAGFMNAQTGKPSSQGNGEPTPRQWNINDLGYRLRQALAELESEGAGRAGANVAEALGESVEFGEAPDLPMQRSIDTLLESVRRQQANELSQAALQRSEARVESPMNDALRSATFEAQPVREASGSTRMPTMIEQVRQISEFMASRVEGVVQMDQKGVEANLKLYPPDLGQVKLRLSMGSDASLQARFVVDQAETAKLIKNHLQHLTEGLARHGMNLDNVQVTVAASSSSLSSQQDLWQQQAQNQERWQSQREARQEQRNRQQGGSEYQEAYG